MTSLYQGVDSFVITPVGSTPPILGSDLPETKEEKKKRRSSSSNLMVDPHTIYTLSYHTMYVDLLEWQIVRIPGFRPIDLEG